MTSIPYGLLAHAPQPALERAPTVLVVGTGFLALLLVAAFWSTVRWAITIAHEGGHALFLSVLGGTVASITLGKPAGAAGLTTSKKGVSGGSHVLVAVAGYTGPSLFGVLAAILLSVGRSAPVLWISVFLLAMVLLQVLATWNPFGVFAVLTTGTILVLFARYGSPLTQTIAAHTWTWLLLIGGFWHVVGFRRMRRAAIQAARKSKNKDKDKDKELKSDARVLRDLTHIPEPLWVFVFLVATLAALIFGGGVLLGSFGPQADRPSSPASPSVGAAQVCAGEEVASRP